MSVAPATLATIALLAAMTGGLGILFRNSLRRFAADFPKPATAERLPPAAISVAALWLTLSLLSRLLAVGDEPRELTLSGIQFSCLISFGIAALLMLALTDGGRRAAKNHGIFLDQFERQALLGLAGYLAAIGPTGLLLMISMLWRTVDTQHAYLKALHGDSGNALLLWILLSAVVAAPLTEELLFRVTLQGWLGERLSGPAAIGITALVFALVHGWRDALPLIPLSLILSGIFHRTRSYWACVTTHALFNGTNIALALMAYPGPAAE